MTRSNNSFYLMLVGVYAYLQAKTTLPVAVTNLLGKLSDFISGINTTTSQAAAGHSTGGGTYNKEAKRAEVVRFGGTIAAALYVWSLENSPELSGFFKSVNTPAKFNKGNITTFVSNAQKLVDHANANATALADFGITSQNILDFETATKALDQMKHDVRSSIALGAATQKQLNVLLKTCRAFLPVLDAAMLPVRLTDEVTYNEYKQLRLLVDAPTLSTGVTFRITYADGTPFVSTAIDAAKLGTLSDTMRSGPVQDYMTCQDFYSLFDADYWDANDFDCADLQANTSRTGASAFLAMYAQYLRKNDEAAYDRLRPLFALPSVDFADGSGPSRNVTNGEYAVRTGTKKAVFNALGKPVELKRGKVLDLGTFVL